MTAFAFVKLLAALIILQALFLGFSALCGLLTRIDFDQLNLGTGPALWTHRLQSWLELRVCALLPLGASVRFVGMLPDEDPAPDDATTPEGTRATARPGWSNFIDSALWRRLTVLLGPWVTLLALGCLLMGLTESLEVLPRVHRALLEAAWSPLEVGRPMVVRWGARVDGGAVGSALGRLLVAVVAVNLLPWPPMAMGVALLQPFKRSPLALGVVGVLLSAALGVGWLVALGAALVLG